MENILKYQKLKAAQLTEKMGKEKDAKVLYKELYDLDKKLIYKEFVLEKMIYFALKDENKTDGKKYYLELKAINPKKQKNMQIFLKRRKINEKISSIFIFIKCPCSECRRQYDCNRQRSNWCKQRTAWNERDRNEKKCCWKEQKIDSGSVELSGENLKNQQQKIKVVQNEKSALEDELSQGVEKKSFLKYVIGALGVVVLIIAL